MNVLLVDIGNSRIKARVADIGIDPAGGNTESGWLGPTRVADTEDAGVLVAGFAALHVAIDAIVVSNVASARRDDDVERAAAACWPIASIHHVAAERERGGVVNGYQRPERLGADRWMALLGARSRAPQHSVLVCSFGTATTIDLLIASVAEDRSDFVGGLILPGFQAMRSALSTSTARLSSAEGRARDFADGTADAMTSGVLAAQAGAVERALHQARARLAETPGAASLRCLLTGGHAAVVDQALQGARNPVTVVPDLVLHGLRRWSFETLRDGAFASRPRHAVTIS